MFYDTCIHIHAYTMHLALTADAATFKSYSIRRCLYIYIYTYAYIHLL